MSDEYVAYMGWGFSAQKQIDGFRREVRELKAENAELRIMRDTWQENDAKLRELVRDMRAYIDGLTNGLPIHGYEMFDKRMHDLGMGVDE